MLGKEVYLNLKRSGFMSLISIGTIIMAIVTLGGYYIINSSVNYFILHIENKVEIVAFLKDSCEKGKCDNIITELQAMPDVAEAKFISKEDAYQQFSKDDEIRKILDSIGSNPLPDTIVVRLKKYTAKIIKDTVKFISSKDGVEDVQYGEEEIENLINIINVVKIITFVAGVIFILSALLVVSNIIRLTIYARREDIYVFQMVGADDNFIRAPYIMEGTLHGFIGGLIGWGVLYIVINVLISRIKMETGMDFSKFYLFTPYFFSFKFMVALVATGMGLGFLGSLLSPWRTLK